MSERLPQANLYVGKYTDSQLISRAQQVHDAMLANVATFPALDLPVPMATLLALIVDYRTTSAAAIKGSKAQTTAKHTSKQNLVFALKALAIYVTQVATANGSGTPQNNLIARTTILLSGFLVSFEPDPVDPINGIPMPQIRRAISEAAGTLKILARQYTNANRNTLLWQVNYRTSAIPANPPDPAVPAGPWLTQTFTGQNQIILTGLDSGIMYDWQIAAIGGRDVKRNSEVPVNYTPVESVVII